MNELLIVDKLRHYAALEVRRGETDKVVIRLLMEALALAMKPCIGIEIMGMHQVGSTEFVRFRTDVPNAVMALPDRAHITASPNGGFVARLPNGRQGRVPSPPMFFDSMQRKVFHGPAMPNWWHQFDC